MLRETLGTTCAFCLMVLPVQELSAVPIQVTFSGSFLVGQTFDEIDISGLAFQVDMLGDTTFADQNPDPLVGQFNGFTTTIRIPAIAEFDLIDDANPTGLFVSDTDITMTSVPATNSLLFIAYDGEFPGDVNRLGPFSLLDNGTDLGGFFGSSGSPLDTVDRGRAFSTASNVPLSGVTAVLTASVPEPTTLALLALGFLALVFPGRRRLHG